MILTVSAASWQVAYAIRRVYLEGVASRIVQEDGLVGRFFTLASVVPRPAVPVGGGSGGGLAWSVQADALLACHRFSTLVLAYFDAESLPSELRHIPPEYFGEPIEWLRKQPEVGDGQAGMLGRSRGGELALLVGARYPVVGVAYAPSVIVSSGYPDANLPPGLGRARKCHSRPTIREPRRFRRTASTDCCCEAVPRVISALLSSG